MAGCVQACNDLYGCMGFTLPRGAMGKVTDQGMLKSVWKPETSQEYDLYRKTTVGEHGLLRSEISLTLCRGFVFLLSFFCVCVCVLARTD